MSATILSEWTKLRTQRGALIAVAAMCVLMVGMSALAASESHTDAVVAGDDDVVQIALAGVVFAALAAVVAGASAMTSEYSTGMIRTTLSVQPRRGVVFAAKALVFAAVTLVTGLIASFASFFVGQALMSGHHLSVTLGAPKAKQLARVERGAADVATPTAPLPSQANRLELRYASQLHADSIGTLQYMFLNTRVPPFDNPDARRAINEAVDRGRLVELLGGRAAATATCQSLPPGFPGYQPYCPYGSTPSPARRRSGWSRGRFARRARGSRRWRRVRRG